MYQITRYHKISDDNYYCIELLDTNTNKPIKITARMVPRLTVHHAIKPVPDVRIEGEYNEELLYNTILLQYPLFVYYTPSKYLNDELYMKLVKIDPNTIKHIPQNKRTIEICIESVSHNGLNYRYVPKNIKEIIGEELQEIAVKQNPFALGQMKDLSEKSYRICELAVLAKPKALKFVPSFFIPTLYRELKDLGLKVEEHFTPEEIIRYEKYLQRNILDLEHLQKRLIV